MLTINPSKFYDEVNFNQCENMFEMDSIEEEMTYSDPNSSDYFYLDITRDGLHRSNMFLNHTSFENFDQNLDSFQKIMNNPEMVIIEKNLEIACFTHLYLEYGEEFMQQFIECMDKYNISMDSNLEELARRYFYRSVSQLRNYLNNDENNEFKNDSHFQINDSEEDWNAVDYYKMILANKECINNLGQFRNHLNEISKPKKKIKKEA